MAELRKEQKNLTAGTNVLHKRRNSAGDITSVQERQLRRNMKGVNEILSSTEKEIINIRWNLLLCDVVRAKRIISFGKRFQSYAEDIYVIYITIYTSGY